MKERRALMVLSCFLLTVVLLVLCGLPGHTAGDSCPMPACLSLTAGQTPETAIREAGVADHELLARLVYAETASTGFPDDAAVYEAIAWGVMNRVRLADASPSMRRVYGKGISGVVFRKGQFNPAVSVRSRFSRDFLCPRDPQKWGMAVAASGSAIRGEGNPFIATSWEKGHGLSLVVNFYYPVSVQAKGPLAPWEGMKGLEFIGDVRTGQGELSALKVRFYRLTRAPADVKEPRPSP